MVKVTLVFVLSCAQLVGCLYLRGAADARNRPSAPENALKESDWNIYKRKLGLTNEKVQLLKQQKDQKTTLQLINRFLKENPNLQHPNEATQPKEKPESSADVLKFYHKLLKAHPFSQGTLKTSFNFVLKDDSKKALKRPRRKIALNMVSDLPAEKIDDLIKMFAAQHGIDKEDTAEADQDPTDDYNGESLAALLSPAESDKDYSYENLYEDEEDLASPLGTHTNSEYGSFQDLILQATRKQKEREAEETKLLMNKDRQFV